MRWKDGHGSTATLGNMVGYSGTTNRHISPIANRAFLLGQPAKNNRYYVPRIKGRPSSPHSLPEEATFSRTDVRSFPGSKFS